MSAPEFPEESSTAFQMKYADVAPSYAQERFGRPITELSRTDQKCLEKIAVAETKEITRRVKTLKQLEKETRLSGAEAKRRQMQCIPQLQQIAEKLGNDIFALQNEKTERQAGELEGYEPDGLDLESVTESDGDKSGFVRTRFKTPGGKLKRELLFTEKLTKIHETISKTVDSLMEMPGEKKAIFVKEQNNTQIISAQAGIDRLKQFAEAPE